MGSGEWGKFNKIYSIPSPLIPIPYSLLPSLPNEVDKRLVSIVDNLVANVIE
ncbi:hypothetical protein [Nostoc sp. CHAB 5715]|uniref:hypothetical protein n=1 Tax=Nostoc sp. CHAB 5715 TaxID=2780400 RepID=UPI001E4C59B6|nr:hypothetical protein [Nostoc sp. CHAB 5715]MCC5620585.1 hypothetical protein [Nostoc sp. CHAB 5715]